MPVPKGKRFIWIVVIAAVFTAVSPQRGLGSLRRVGQGDVMPSFSLKGVNGQVFTYDANHAGGLGIVVMKAGQSQLSRIAGDLEPVIKELKASGKPFDCIGVMCGPGADEYLKSYDGRTPPSFPLLLDPDFELWGKLGVIAAPTAVVVGPDHRLQWAKAGYGYDFVPSFHAQLAEALGLRAHADVSTPVVTLSNASSQARLERHVQMAKTLVKKGRFDLAAAELKRAQSLDPNALEIVLEYGELLCRTGENNAALEVVAQAKAQTNPDRARVLLISGWARRQLGQLDAAESLLVEASRLDPRYSRIPFELGKVHQAKGDFETAALWYRRALERVFDESDVAASAPH